MVHALFLTNSQNLTSQKLPVIMIPSTLVLCLFLLTKKNFQSATMHIAGTLRNINEERTVHVS